MLGFNVGDEAPLVFLVGELLDGLRSGVHDSILSFAIPSVISCGSSARTAAARRSRNNSGSRPSCRIRSASVIWSSVRRNQCSSVCQSDLSVHVERFMQTPLG